MRGRPAGGERESGRREREKETGIDSEKESRGRERWVFFHGAETDRELRGQGDAMVSWGCCGMIQESRLVIPPFYPAKDKKGGKGVLNKDKRNRKTLGQTNYK